MKYGFVVPVYNHGSTLKEVVENLNAYGFPIIVVDDGNDEKNKAYIAQVAEEFDSVVVVTHEKNRGKGAAMQSGILKANEMGLTHVLQIDSDGQHDAFRVKHFLELSEKHPDSVICGYPEYDASAPKKRVNGRKVANAWIHIVTLSKSIKDALIGFRVYPVGPYMRLVKRHVYVDPRMGYDAEILVHLYWIGVPVISESVKVSYPKDGVSNFRVVRDNLHIAGSYTRLCLGMIVRIPKLLAINIRRRKNAEEFAD